MDELIQPYRGERDELFRDSLYSGVVFRIPPSEVSLAAIEYAWRKVVGSMDANPRQTHQTIDADEHFRRVGLLRRELYLSGILRQFIARLIRQIGSDPAMHVCDPVRLRVVTSGGHFVKAAAPVYYAHRDTWYANSQSQITWWLPLHPVATRETFEFLPGYFAQAVANDSVGFDYNRWTSQGNGLKIGWQDPNAGLREQYPRLREPLPSARRVSFTAQPGEAIVFSGQHLHQTIPIEHGVTRYSIDFRTVHLKDHQTGRGPMNVDNRSSGSALSGHVPLAESAYCEEEVVKQRIEKRTADTRRY